MTNAQERSRTARGIPNPEGPRPKVLITAGPTAEDIDPVRYITNRSTGRMGMEVAAAARRADGTPLLILGPTPLDPPAGIPAIRVRSAADMCREVVERLPWCDALVMTAAVADYTPAEPLDAKLKKQDGELVLRLRRTPDILKTIMPLPARAGRFIAGFSLDIGMNLDEGWRKLREKGLDLIVVNTVSSFASDSASATLLTPGGSLECGSLSKTDLANEIVSRIIAHSANAGR